MPTVPGSGEHNHTAPVVIVPAMVTDPKSGAVLTHKDFEEYIAPWDNEAHIKPVSEQAHLGDVASWAAYVKRYTGDSAPYLRWNATGIYATLDYHEAGKPGRAQWTASYPFTWSRQWNTWTRLAEHGALSHADLIDALEDNAEDIVEPEATALMELLRGLKMTVNKSLDLQRREDGTTYVQMIGDNRVAARGGTTDLPTTISIGIPVFKEHKDKDGAAVVYKLAVRLRASLTDNKISFYLTIPGAAATQERAVDEQIDKARAALGDDVELWRAAD